MTAFWKEAYAELAAGRRLFLAFVASCSKGSPGTPKAKLLVKQDGSQVGTIGGGIMEQSLLQNALKALRQKRFQARLQKISHQAKADNPSGLICGGSQSNALAVLEPETDADTVRRILDALQTEANAAIQLTAAGLDLLPHPSDLRSPSRLLEDGASWSYQLSTVNHRRIAIFGAGHCGQALATQMNLLGYHVSLTDTRSTLSLPQGIQNLSTFIPETPHAACRSLRHWEKTAVVVMTHSYPTDLAALQEVLPFDPPFIGLMGSPPKLSKIRHELAALGFSPKQVGSLRAPVGLAIGSDTPEEIAVSIAAQLLQEHNLSTLNEPNFADHVSP